MKATLGLFVKNQLYADSISFNLMDLLMYESSDLPKDAITDQQKTQALKEIVESMSFDEWEHRSSFINAIRKENRLGRFLLKLGYDQGIDGLTRAYLYFCRTRTHQPLHFERLHLRLVIFKLTWFDDYNHHFVMVLQVN